MTDNKYNKYYCYTQDNSRVCLFGRDVNKNC